ncbi:hypothetical protein N1851_012824 [Merluccius polli]|uniref:Uncharacterized protein n=1 Tax=Merluccius polli TaxID=89951 RepID=A0AA47MWZ9_MERPO|nr:hypothetical protein N1851_012824 [Merluccius polli]
MFHQFHVQVKDRKYLRFLWWKNRDMSTQPQEYRMKVLFFWCNIIPWLHKLWAQFIARDFYVDDGVTSAETVERAIQLAQERYVQRVVSAFTRKEFYRKCVAKVLAGMIRCQRC